MFKKILLPLDLTDKHELALHTAKELSASDKSEVILLHVVELIPGLDRAEEAEFYNRLERRARAHLANLGSKLTREHIRWHAEVVFGNRAASAASFAAQHGVDLIVLTAPPFHLEHPAAGIGSMTWRISLIATCPVLLVKQLKEKTAGSTTRCGCD